MSALKKAAVIGWPVKHSLSPAIHAFWRQQYGIDGRFVRVACKPTEQAFRELIGILARQGYAGANVTIPHKKHAYDVATWRSETAELLGVANMLTLEGDDIAADNSDVIGFREMILPLLEKSDSKGVALVLGAGGAAPAVCLALHQLGYREIVVSNRTNDTAQTLLQQFDFIGNSCKWEESQEAIKTADILVNTTSLGMKGQPDLDISLEEAKTSLIVADIVYTPLETGLLRKARQQNHRYVHGLDMLMHQAVPGFRQWFDRNASVTTELKDDLTTRLNRRSSKPVRIGLTGSIGMGKSTAAAVLKEAGAAVWDADSAVHRLYAKGGAGVEPIAAVFPEAIADSAVSREKLSAHLLEHPEDFPKLGQVVHPLVAEDREQFLKDAVQRAADVVVLDIPLLLETGQAHEFDEIIVVTADLDVRRKRVLDRPGMTSEKFEAIVAQQMPEEEKILLADHVIRTDQPVEETAENLRDLYERILENYRT